jgi:hypothetical protein
VNNIRVYGKLILKYISQHPGKKVKLYSFSAISIYSNFCISKKVRSKKTAVFRSLYHFYKENNVLSRVLPMHLVARLLYTNYGVRMLRMKSMKILTKINK